MEVPKNIVRRTKDRVREILKGSDEFCYLDRDLEWNPREPFKSRGIIWFGIRDPRVVTLLKESGISLVHDNCEYGIYVYYVS